MCTASLGRGEYWTIPKQDNTVDDQQDILQEQARRWSCTRQDVLTVPFSWAGIDLGSGTFNTLIVPHVSQITDAFYVGR